MAHKNTIAKVTGQTKILDWYKDRFPTDEWAIERMNKSATFQDAFVCLQVGFDFYTFLGTTDSLVRERVFDALAALMGCSYDHIYYQWLNKDKNPLRGAVYTDMRGLRFINEDTRTRELTEAGKEVISNYESLRNYEECMDGYKSEMLLERAVNVINDFVHFIND